MTQAWKVCKALINCLHLFTDPAFIVQSRIFTPDSMVITLSMLCVYGALRYKYHHNPQSSASGWLLHCGLLCGIIIRWVYLQICLLYNHRGSMKTLYYPYGYNKDLACLRV